ncbi:type II toxin-antitoxin system RelE/ParE family toxin [Lunatibacter salilacus]|uniref:type II toxin-antitoxin system RelE/ParE family toxin n=1 Tax=Lunatibacter salilacus TaxID=2483804 RepID=UPI00131DDA9F|nr:type II toxin-antitoxin system RelE/ParE family toxin [Lunatibacter salilacus]
MRIIEVFRDYFWEFYNGQKLAVREKIDYALNIVMNVHHIPQKFFTHVEDGIYEVRVKVGSDIYRIFCFFDDGKLVILLNGFQKKTQKIPKNEIEKALRLRREYYEDKKSTND